MHWLPEQGRLADEPTDAQPQATRKVIEIGADGKAPTELKLEPKLAPIPAQDDKPAN